MKIAVTGGSGFVGTHLVNILVKKGHSVIIVDNREPQCKDSEWRKTDILDMDAVTESLQSVDVVFHLAAIADASFAYENYIKTFEVNTIGTLNLLEASRKRRVSRFVYASTIWVYNASEEIEVNELTRFGVDTKHVYTTTKLFGEYLCYDYCNMHNLNFTIFRFGIPFGPGSAFNVIPLFIRKALNGEPLTIRGLGEQKRQFIFVEDLAEGCTRALRTEAENEVFNLVGPEMISVKQVAETIGRKIKGTSIKYIPEREGELDYKLVSSLKAKEKLDWSPKTTFEDGITKTINWYRKNND